MFIALGYTLRVNNLAIVENRLPLAVCESGSGHFESIKRFMPLTTYRDRDVMWVYRDHGARL